MEMFVDAGFVGMHGYEDPEDPISVHESPTRYMIFITKCPALGVSRLHCVDRVS
jgi:hypothetical protein